MCRYMVASIKDWPGLIKNIFEYAVSRPFVLSSVLGVRNPPPPPFLLPELD